jgi:PAS domain S-box-containing protein
MVKQRKTIRPARKALDDSTIKNADIFFHAFEKFPLGVILADADGRTLFINESFTKITGYELSDIPRTEDWFAKAYPDEDQRGRILADWKQNLQENFSRTVSHLVTRKDGSVLRVEFRGSWIAEGVLALTVEDITERAAAERTSKALYEISNAVSVTRDLNDLYATLHRILHAHIDATNFFIALVDEAADRIVFPYFSDEVDDYYDIPNISALETNNLTLEVIRSGKPLLLRNEALLEKKKRGEIAVVGTDPAVWLGAPLTVKGRVIGAMAVQHYENPLHYGEHDIRFLVAVSEQAALAIERKSAEEALAKLNEELESKVAARTMELAATAGELSQANARLTELDETKSALLSSVSHELRTPLTSIMGFTKLIHREFLKYFSPLDKEGDREASRRAARIADNLGIITAETERLTRLINEFLDLAKIESGRMPWNDQPLDPGMVARQAGEAARGLFENNPEASLLVQVAPGLPRILADPDKIQQTLMNLITNAAKFTARGTVSLSVSSAMDGIVSFEVADTGPGIAPEHLPQVFEKFYKVEAAEQDMAYPRGAGLGLAICRQIAEHYGGGVRVASTLGSGSVFTVDLPAMAPED